jgi:hypothetical protein
LDEPPAETLERKPRDVVVRSKSRGNKSGERPLKKPTQANVLSFKKARLNLLAGSVKTTNIKDLSDPIIMGKEIADLMQKRKASNSKSKKLPYKPIPGIVSAFDCQIMQPQIINQSAMFMQTSAKKLAQIKKTPYVPNNDLCDISLGRRVTKRSSTGCEI